MKTAFCFVFLMSLVSSDLDEFTSDYSESGGPMEFSGEKEEIKTPWLVGLGWLVRVWD